MGKISRAIIIQFQSVHFVHGDKRVSHHPIPTTMVEPVEPLKHRQAMVEHTLVFTIPWVWADIQFLFFLGSLLFPMDSNVFMFSCLRGAWFHHFVHAWCVSQSPLAPWVGESLTCYYHNSASKNPTFILPTVMHSRESGTLKEGLVLFNTNILYFNCQTGYRSFELKRN